MITEVIVNPTQRFAKIVTVLLAKEYGIDIEFDEIGDTFATWRPRLVCNR